MGSRTGSRRRPVVVAAVAATLWAASAASPVQAAGGTVPVRRIGLVCPSAFVPEDRVRDAGPDGSALERAVDCVTAYGVMEPRVGPLFKPSEPVLRGELASALMGVVDAARGALRPSNPPDAFVDDDGTEWESDINAAAALGLMSGARPTEFVPEGYVSRGQLATFLANAVLGVGAPLRHDVADAFPDDSGAVHESNINALAAVGVLGEADGSGYEPLLTATRSDVARFGARLLDYLVDVGAVDPRFGLDVYPAVGSTSAADFDQELQCTVYTPVGQSLVLALLPHAGPAASDNGAVFPAVDTADGRYAALGGGNRLRFVSIDGSTVSALSDLEPVVSDGAIDVVLRTEHGVESDALLLVYDQGSDLGLRVDAEGTPTEPYGFGCRVHIGPREARPGPQLVTVQSVHDGYFRDPGGLAFYWEPGDTFAAAHGALSAEDFAGVLSRGDQLMVDYQTRTSTAASTFDVIDDRVWAPEGVGASVWNADGGLTPNDVHVSFRASPLNGPGTVHLLERWSAAHPGGDGVCGTTDDLLASGWQSLGTVTATPSEPHVDHDVGPGCHRYRITATNPSSGAASDGVLTNEVAVGLV